MPKHRVKRHAVTQPSDPSYRLIPLTQGQNAIVDSVEYEWLMQWNWLAHWSPHTRSYYAVRCDATTKVRVYIQMHRLVLGRGEYTECDHKNSDTLDNRRCNLRKATGTQNARHRRLRSDNTSGFKGVSWHRHTRKWQAAIHASGTDKYLGIFNSSNEAARAYDEAAKQFFGEFAHLNFPGQE